MEHLTELKLEQKLGETPLQVTYSLENGSAIECDAFFEAGRLATSTKSFFVRSLKKAYSLADLHPLFFGLSGRGAFLDFKTLTKVSSLKGRNQKIKTPLHILTVSARRQSQQLVRAVDQLGEIMAVSVYDSEAIEGGASVVGVLELKPNQPRSALRQVQRAPFPVEVPLSQIAQKYVSANQLTLENLIGPSDADKSFRISHANSRLFEDQFVGEAFFGELLQLLKPVQE